MAIFASTTLGTGDPSRAMSIKALEARAQALAAAQSKQEMPTSLPSPWQGASLVLNQAADAFATKRADQAAAQRRQDLAGYIAKAGDNPTMADVGQITGADAETGRAYMQEIAARRTAAAQVQAAKEAAAEKARTDLEYAAQQPKSDLGRITADVGRQPTAEEAAASIKKITEPSAAEKKAGNEQEDQNINLQSTVTVLKEARGLLEGPGVYSGAGAGAKEFMGRNLPGVGEYVAGTSKEMTDRTNRYNQIVNAQALDLLSQLKGASSDRDMAWAIRILNDKNSDIDTKKRALDTLIPRVEAHRLVSEQRLKAMGREPVKVETPAPSAGGPAAAGGGVQNVASEAEALALPPGTKFKLPDGRTGTAR